MVIDWEKLWWYNIVANLLYTESNKNESFMYCKFRLMKLHQWFMKISTSVGILSHTLAQSWARQKPILLRCTFGDINFSTLEPFRFLCRKEIITQGERPFINICACCRYITSDLFLANGWKIYSNTVYRWCLCWRTYLFGLIYFLLMFPLMVISLNHQNVLL